MTTSKMIVDPVSRKVAIPAGTYFLGDPCYAVPEEDWESMLESSDFFRNVIGEVNGHQVMAFPTKWGDGEYYDQHGNAYPVDAGLIGLTPYEYATKLDKGYDQCGLMVTFESDVIAHTALASGILCFGEYRIDTDPEDDEDEEIPWDEEDDEETWNEWGLNES